MVVSLPRRLRASWGDDVPAQGICSVCSVEWRYGVTGLSFIYVFFGLLVVSERFFDMWNRC